VPSMNMRLLPHRNDARRRPRRSTASITAMVAGISLLTAGPAAAAPVLEGLLSSGSDGPSVKDVQRALHLSTTGHFSSAMRRAVIRFQRHQGLLVDGIVGPQTWDRLFGITPTTSSTPLATPTSGTASASGSGGYSVPAGIVQCESGGDYSAVNPSSGAGGAYQILPSTWQAYGGQGLPQDAPPAEQDRIAAEIYAAQGSSAWSC
jgi:peptidoglycan hydrolase-like protein with peptidoglycan-binding domain